MKIDIPAREKQGRPLRAVPFGQALRLYVVQPGCELAGTIYIRLNEAFIASTQQPPPMGEVRLPVASLATGRVYYLSDNVTTLPARVKIVRDE